MPTKSDEQRAAEWADAYPTFGTHEQRQRWLRRQPAIGDVVTRDFASGVRYRTQEDARVVEGLNNVKTQSDDDDSLAEALGFAFATTRRELKAEWQADIAVMQAKLAKQISALRSEVRTLKSLLAEKMK